MHMNKDSTTNSLTASVCAVRQYIALDNKNIDKHRVNVLVHVNGKDFSPGIRVASIKEGNNTVEIVIEELHTIYGSCSNRFTLEDSSFSLIHNTLQIRTKDAFQQKMTIEVTGI